jgi:hypothetical protein
MLFARRDNPADRQTRALTLLEYTYVVDEYDEGTKKHTVTLKRLLDKA